MKKYKVIARTNESSFEEDLNDYGFQGWKVIASNIAFKGENNDEVEYHAIIELDEDDEINMNILDSINSTARSIESCLNRIDKNTK